MINYRRKDTLISVFSNLKSQIRKIFLILICQHNKSIIFWLNNQKIKNHEQINFINARNLIGNGNSIFLSKNVALELADTCLILSGRSYLVNFGEALDIFVGSGIMETSRKLSVKEIKFCNFVKYFPFSFVCICRS